MTRSCPNIRSNVRERPPILNVGKTVAAIAGLAALYFTAAKLGLTLAFLNASATAVWPPTGIALAALLLMGTRVWPGVFLGALLANLTTAGTLMTSLGIAAGNTLEALFGAYLVNRFAGGRDAFDQAQNIFRFVLLAAMISTTVSATMGVTTLSLGGFVRPGDYGPVWLTWWLGDAAGAIVIASFVLLWSRHRRVTWTRAQMLEGACLIVAVLVVAGVIFGGLFSFEYLTVPLLAWAAFRFGPRETATVIVLLSGIAIWGTLHGAGPFLAATQNASLLLLQAFMAIMALVNLPVAAVVAERRQAEERLRESEQRFRTLYQRERGTVDILQRSLLPTRLPTIPGLMVAARYVPAAPEPLGGDWYDVFPLAGGRVGLVMGDVAGHGVGAAAVMAKLRNALRAYAMEGHSPKDVAERLNRVMERGEMASVVYLVLDPLRWHVSYFNAGQPPPVVLEPTGAVKFLDQSSIPLGTRISRSYDEHEVDLTPQSTLLLYTDGIIETRRGAEARLTKLERAVAGRPATDLDGLLAYLLNQILGESAPIDDAALLAVAASPLDPRRFHIELVALPDSLAALRNALRRWLPHIGATAEEIFAVTTAVGEAAANAIEHAYGPKEAAFEVEALVETGKLAIAVRDKGRWRPPRGPMRGHGLKMMRELMDSVEVASGPEGTMIRLSHTLRNAVRP